MNLKHLQTFVTLSEVKSFTKAAVISGCAQSGVTTHIKRLEETLGVQLFERIGKQVFLTSAGETLLPYAKKILALSTEMETLFAHSDKLTIGVTESVANFLFGDLLKEFSALCPDTEIFLKLADGRDYCQMLCSGEIDLAIVLDLPVKHKTVRIMHKRKENILLAAASTHALAGKTRVTPAEIQSFGMLLPLPDCAYRNLLEQDFLAEGTRITPALETSSSALIKESSLCGVGLGLLPEFAVQKELIYHMLEKVNYKIDYPVYTQVLIHPDKWRSPSLSRFLEIAKRHLT